MYKLTNPNPPSTNSQFVIRLLDNAFIPLYDPDNTDYQAYLRWLEAGNTPEPAEENQ
jgi:hypothetical protein